MKAPQIPKPLSPNKAPQPPQPPKIDVLDEKAKRSCAPNPSPYSTSHKDNVEAGFGENMDENMEDTEARSPRLHSRIMLYAIGWRQEGSRRKAVGDWISSPRVIYGSMVLGTIIIIILFSLSISFYTRLHHQLTLSQLSRASEMRTLVASWTKPPNTTSPKTHQTPEDLTRDIIPIPCHSHNDYTRQIPLYQALAAGCTGVEADVWLTDPTTLLVGHTKSSLHADRSLESMYINPLLTILSALNPSPPSSSSNHSSNWTGIFSTSPHTSLILLIDIKTPGPSTLPLVHQSLEPLRTRGYLTHRNGTSLIPGPITVVGTGNTPFTSLLTNSTYTDIFYDAPLSDLFGEAAPANNTLYTSSNSYYTSVSFAQSIGKLWHGVLRPEQVEVIRGQVGEARRRGLRARYWDTPSWPVGVRDHVWDVLVKEGVGMLSVDEVGAAGGRRW